jgi:hypothetical protein
MVVGALALAVWGALRPAGSEEQPPRVADASTARWSGAGTKGLEARGLSCLRAHPRDRGVLWAYVHGLGPARSTDGGATWAVRLNGVPEKDRPGLRSQVRITLDPGDDRVLYVTIDGQIYRSEDKGATWSSITSGALTSLSWDNLRSAHLSWEVRVDPRNGRHLLVGTRNDGDHNGGLYESTNSGKSWEEVAGSAQPDSGLGNDTLFVRPNPSSDRFIMVAGRTAVWWSDSRGRTFKRNDPGGGGLHDIRDVSDYAGKALYLADARGIWRSKDGGRRWDKKPLLTGDAVAVEPDPHSKRRVYAVLRDRGVVMSEDPHTATWKPVGVLHDDTAGAAAPPPGLRAQMIGEVLVHPREKKDVYFASPVTGLYVSHDGGTTVVPVRAPKSAKPGSVIPTILPSLACVAVHPGDRSTAEEGCTLVVSDEGMVYRSADRGGTWLACGPLGMKPGGIVPEAALHTWLAYGRRLLRTTDDGDTWTVLWPTTDQRPPVDPEERIVDLQILPEAEGADTPPRLAFVLERSASVWASSDDGKTWTTTRGPKLHSTETWAAALALDPGAPGHLVLATRSTREAWSPRDENGGVFETWDAGRTWKDVTGALAPGRKASPEERNQKAYWNRASFLALDAKAGLVVYGADRCGLFARPIRDPSAKDKPKEAPTWVDVTPPQPAHPTISAAVVEQVPDGEDNDATHAQIVAQLRGANGETAIVAIAGSKLASLRAALAQAADTAARADAHKAEGWTALPSPGAGLVLSCLAADARIPGRLVASERGGTKGVLLYETPGAHPEGPKKAAPKKEAPKEAPPRVLAPPVPPDAMRAFTAGADKTWRVWALATGDSTQAVAGHEGPLTALALSPDGKTIATAAEDHTVRLWNAADGKPTATVSVDETVPDLVFGADGHFLYAAGGKRAAVLQIDMKSHAVRRFGVPKAGVLSVAASDDAHRLYSGGADHVIRVWDTTKARQVNAIKFGAPVQALVVSADGTRVYAAGANTVAAFDAAGKPAGRLGGLAAPVGGLALDPSGDVLYATGPDGVLAIDTKTMKVKTNHDAPDGGGITCVTTSSDGLWVLAGDEHGGLWVWIKGQPAAWRARAQKHAGPVRAVAVTRETTPRTTLPAPGANPPGKDGSAKDGSGKDGSGKDGSGKDGSGKDAPGKGAPADGGTAPKRG